MKLEILIGGLNNPQPAVRLDVVRVLGMLDEVRALDALRQRYQIETDPTVRSAIAWAGKRLYEAQQAGYSTLDEIFRHFGVDREIENMPDAEEAELMKKLQDGLDADLIRMQEQANRRQMGMATAAGIGVGLVGGVMAGGMAFAGAMTPGALSASSNMGPRPQIGMTRSPATAPSNADINIWVRRLRESPTPAQREQAAIELSQLNNPAALPFLAASFLSDESPKVRQAAQRFGKILYWGAIYWEMEQDGSLQAEINRRAAARGIRVKPADNADPQTSAGALPGGSAPFTPPQPPKPESQEDVGDILKRARAARAQRNQRRT